ncbi:hypothetical protein ES705_40809 [subsurface metagenome]
MGFDDKFVAGAGVEAEDSGVGVAVTVAVAVGVGVAIALTAVVIFTLVVSVCPSLSSTSIVYSPGKASDVSNVAVNTPFVTDTIFFPRSAGPVTLTLIERPSLLEIPAITKSLPISTSATGSSFTFPSPIFICNIFMKSSLPAVPTVASVIIASICSCAFAARLERSPPAYVASKPASKSPVLSLP